MGDNFIAALPKIVENLNIFRLTEENVAKFGELDDYTLKVGLLLRLFMLIREQTKKLNQTHHKVFSRLY